MQQLPVRRLAGIVVLLGCLLGLTIWFGSLASAPEVGAYPDEDQLGTDYDSWVGKEASLTGTVVDTDPLTIVAEYGTDSQIRLRISDTAVDARQGDRLAVFGVVEPNHTVRALNAYTIPPANYLYMYVVSFLAGLWVLGRLVRTWRLDWETWSLVPRITPLTLGDLHSQDQTTEDHDA